MTDDDLPTADDVRGILKADIVERLRSNAARWDWTGSATATLEREAADEIERLRGALQKIVDQANQRLIDGYQAADIAEAALDEQVAQ